MNRTLGFLSLLFLLWIQNSLAETTIDACSVVSPRRSRLNSLIVSSSNLVVDTTSAETYDGDAGRYKRTNARHGIVSYISARGFERVEISGYVYRLLPKASWALNVHVGDALSTSNNYEMVLRLTASNLGNYITEGGGDYWDRFLVVIKLNKKCPQRIALVLEGSATNNEFSGWGLQLSEVRLTQSWFNKCQARCEFRESACPVTNLVQVVDEARDFRDLYALSPNIERDDSGPGHFNGDRSRFKRTNNTQGRVVYAAVGGIHSIDVEVYQYQPFDTKLTLIPYTTENCQPITMRPTFKSSSRRQGDGWMHRIAHFDLSQLPFCPTKVAVTLEGGEHGWELQVSRVTLVVDLELETNVDVRRKSEDSGEGSSSMFGDKWWIWMVALIGLVVFFLLVAVIVHHVALFFGDDVRTVYHVSHVRNFFRRSAPVIGTPADTDIIPSPKPIEPSSSVKKAQKSSRNNETKPLVENAGKDLSHWFDEETNEVKTCVDSVSGLAFPHTPKGRFIHVPPSTPCSDYDMSFELPWWKDAKYQIGRLTKRVRWIIFKNTLTDQEDRMEVAEEETIAEIRQRYMLINKHAESYGFHGYVKNLAGEWQYAELDMRKTLKENGIPDEAEIYESYNLPFDYHLPVVFTSWMDDLTCL